MLHRSRLNHPKESIVISILDLFILCTLKGVWACAMYCDVTNDHFETYVCSWHKQNVFKISERKLDQSFHFWKDCTNALHSLDLKVFFWETFSFICNWVLF